MLHAVVVGVDAPKDPKIRPLDYAEADAEAVAAVLSDGVTKERQITLLVGERATKARIARVITDELPRRLRANDTVLLYFAGHGSPELEGLGAGPSIHLVVHDTEHARLHTTAINMLSELAVWTRRLQTRIVGIILDASFNGQQGGRTFEGPGLWSGPRTRTLDRISPSRVAVGAQFGLLTACGEKEVAAEDRSYEHGVFTHHLLEALQRPGLGGVSIARLHKITSDAMVESSTNQHPTLHGGGVHTPLFQLDSRAVASASAL